MIISLLMGYLSIFAFLFMSFLEVCKSYCVKWNGRKWVVRDPYGRFVRVTSNIFDVLSLAYKDK